MTGLAASRTPVSRNQPRGEVPEPLACEELFCAIIGLAIKDLERVESLQSKPYLTGYERKKLLTLTEHDHPGEFLQSRWFEQICGMLNLHADTIRVGVRRRHDESRD